MDNLSRRSILVALPILVTIGGARGWRAAEAASPVPEKRLALSGYDPVSYFTEGHPEKGSAEYSATFDDATYWFKSAEHRTLFVNDPDHYAPQFGGHSPRCTRSAGTVNPSGDSMYPIIDSMYPIIVQFRHRPHRLVTEVPETLAILYGADLSGALLVFTKLSRATPTA
jgi:YHS domain-containing protein